MFELLENRMLQSATVDAGGTLTILGTELSERLTVRSVKKGLITVRITDEAPANFAISKVQRIEIDAESGNDEVFLGSLLLPCTILGAAGDDTITGNSGDDFIHGGPGDDTFFASQGNNTLIGGSGDDTFHAVGAFDTINGSTGNDTVDCDNLDYLSHCEQVDQQTLFKPLALSTVHDNVTQTSVGQSVAHVTMANVPGSVSSVSLASRSGDTFKIKVSNYALAGNSGPAVGTFTADRELGQLQAGNYTLFLVTPDGLVHRTLRFTVP